MRETIKDNRGMKIGSYESFLNGKTIVYDENGAKLGEIRPEGNFLVAYNKNGIKMAKWNEKDDCTYDKNNRKNGKGIILAELCEKERGSHVIPSGGIHSGVSCQFFS